MTLKIHVKHLSAGGKTLVHDLHVTCRAGQIVTLMGDSGSGKSTLLAAVCGLAAEGVQFDGDVVLDGKSINHLPCAQRRIGILFQDDLLFAHMTVRENLLFAVPAGTKAAREHAVQEALQTLGFADMAQRSPGTLSGGQRARVSLLRTLLAQPHALLLDEPYSKLDAALRQQFRDFVLTHVRQRALPTLLVTHDAADIADANAVIRLQNPVTAC
jgi:putative thiamine transport system ATP-binding protein